MKRYIVIEECKVWGEITRNTHIFDTKEDAINYMGVLKDYLNEQGSFYEGYKTNDDFCVDEYPTEFMVADGDLTADNYVHIWLKK